MQNGQECLSYLDSFKPDLMILDLMLPDMSGSTYAKKLRRNISPTIIITAKSDSVDKILGMELGADDYITKPFNTREVIARIKALFRRISLIEDKENQQQNSIIELDNGIIIDRYAREVYKNKKKISLTNKEFELLLYLADNRKKVMTRSKLLDEVWGFDFLGDTRTVDMHVQRIRRKLDEDKDKSIIETVFGVGYKLV